MCTVGVCECVLFACKLDWLIKWLTALLTDSWGIPLRSTTVWCLTSCVQWAVLPPNTDCHSAPFHCRGRPSRTFQQSEGPEYRCRFIWREKQGSRPDKSQIYCQHETQWDMPREEHLQPGNLERHSTHKSCEEVTFKTIIQTRYLWQLHLKKYFL